MPVSQRPISHLAKKSNIDLRMTLTLYDSELGMTLISFMTLTFLIVKQVTSGYTDVKVSPCMILTLNQWPWYSFGPRYGQYVPTH